MAEKFYCEKCEAEMGKSSPQLCDSCYEYFYCECGKYLGVYAGEGLCKSCQ